MIILALGTVLSLSGISSCKKPAPRESDISQFYSFRYMDPGQDLYLGDALASRGHAPIPGTLLLFGSGVAGMAWFGWRRRTKR
jgi:hypothetical protein